MRSGTLPLGVFYEDLDFVQLSPYPHGIPSGLEGMRRRLIEADGLEYEGIFRLRGKETSLQIATQRLADHETISNIEASPIEIAQLMKAFYRKIPCDEPGFLPPALLAAKTETEIINGFNALSEPRRSLLLWTFDLWIGIEDMKSFNKMTLQSMSIVFSPNMVRCWSANPMVFLELQKNAQRVTLDAAKLRRERRLMTPQSPQTQSQRNENIVPFKADRESQEEPPEMMYPQINDSTSTSCNSNSLGSMLKGCVVL